jgi:4-hydroxy-2-oxoheptanedioate aldolase
MRSMGGAFAPYGFGLSDWKSYTQIANNEIMVVVQIESTQGLANLDGILSVQGVDVAFVGPNDLHVQLGLPPSTEGAEPEFVAALERIKTTARQHSVACGIFCANGEAAARRIREGFQMVNAAADISCLLEAATRNLRVAQGDR